MTAKGGNRKKKAASKAIATVEENEEERCVATREEESCPTATTDIENKLSQIDEHVEQTSEEMWASAMNEVDGLRSDFKRLCKSIPAKVRNLTLAEFFSLSKDESQSATLHNIQLRIASLLPSDHPDYVAYNSCNQHLHEPVQALPVGIQPSKHTASDKSEQHYESQAQEEIVEEAGKALVPASTVKRSTDATKMQQAQEPDNLQHKSQPKARAGEPSKDEGPELPPPSTIMAAPGTRVTRRTAARCAQLQASEPGTAIPATTRTTRRTRAATKPDSSKIQPAECAPAVSAATVTACADAADVRHNAETKATHSAADAHAQPTDDATGTQQQDENIDRQQPKVDAAHAAVPEAVTGVMSSQELPHSHHDSTVPAASSRVARARKQAKEMAQAALLAAMQDAPIPEAVIAASAAALPPKARQPLQPVNRNEGVAATPAPAQAVSKTSKSQHVVAATPAVGASQHVAVPGTAIAPPSTVLPKAAAGSQVLGGFTLIRKAGALSRTSRSRSATAATAGGGSGSGDGANAMVFTTSSGQQFVVDGESGLSSIPAQFRAEIQAQVEQLQRLAAAALARKS